ncbi:uncharacterized protein LOC114868699 isoform X2 [Betta splendens]|uniref:Uncharacterized protein LOC114868699 isoform X2 n=1 Tax=Betta splendens TaxID=158456 RepID=A0A9W2Y763_BETSP|nr:uncharacterized protein LOC114868699 isoform X2 [Betta splendens]
MSDGIMAQSDRTVFSTSEQEACSFSSAQPQSSHKGKYLFTGSIWSMMARLWAALLLSSLVAEVSSSGEEPASSCTSGWSLFGDRCFAFFPVWSSWSDANSLCAQTQSELVSLNTREELRFLHQLANTSAPVWLGHRAQNGSCSDGAPLSSAARTGHALERACVELEPSGELHSAPCGQLRFYICSTSCCTSVLPSRKPVDPELVPGVSLFDTVWSKSDLLVEEILHSSSFLGALASGRLTEQCYTRFLQQEALYLRRVSITLQTLTARLQEDDGMRALLLDTLQHYRSRVESGSTCPCRPFILWC